MICNQPTKFFFVAGSGEGSTRFTAYDAALLNAGIGDLNLMEVRGVLPPNCEGIDHRLDISAGAIVPCLSATITSQMPGEVIASAIAVAIPKDPFVAGIIQGYSARGHCEDIERLVRAMVVESMEARNREYIEIRSASIEHQVTNLGTAFAGVILWD